MVIARDARGRQSVSGWQNFWFRRMERPIYTEVKAYGVADQPVHRPGDKLRAKLWVGRASYAPEATAAPLRDLSFQVRLLDPRGEVFWEGNKVTDQYGGIDVEVDLPKSVALGVFQFQLRTGNHFIVSNLRVRVEEFRKPEFEVKVEAPEKPIKLGDKIEARVVAKYYFGTPVTDAYVNVKVTRTAYVDDWYPIRPFDWCYGPGYWWFAYDYAWYPGWDRWLGSRMPARAWMPRWITEPAELVLEQEVQLDAEGVAKITIDSAMAAQTQGKQDHKYQIEVEVRDASRRTQTANGSVIASREPFKIYTWLNRGFYQANDTVEANFQALTLDRRPIEAEGKMELLRITYDAERQPQETVVETWDAKTDAEGMFQQRFVARRGGQYRVRLRLKGEDDHEVEGAYIFTVRGEDQVADNYRFAGIELVADKSEYAPGEKVQLQINADQAGATVLLFVRPTGGIVPPPKLIKLPGKSAVYEIDVVANDQPNFFVEALTIYNGKFYSTMREIIVPPTNRVLNVSVKPDKKEYRPGEKARLDIEVKNDAGEPVTGSVLVAVYDRALEQIAADTLPQDIRAFFWKWRRNHQPTNIENLTRVTYPLTIDGLPMLRPIGIFGFTLDDDSGPMEASTEMAPMLGAVGGRGGAFGASGATRGMMMDAMAAPQAVGARELRPMSAGVGKTMANLAVPEMAATSVRQEFADSALWLTNLTCDRNGRAHADYKMPENLSDWQMRSWVLGSNLQVGSGSASAVTHKPILVRLTTPRFLTQRDDVMVSAIVHNDSDSAHDVRVRLEIDGQTQLELHDGVSAESKVHIAAHEQARVEWMCRALAEGDVTLRAFAESAAESDAMQLKVPIIVNGMLKTDSWAGTVRADQPSGSLEITVPEQRRAEHSRLTVRMSPSLALAMVDALPYLVEYPYECTEQTLNRFLPTVMTQRMLMEMKVDLQQVKQRRNNLNAQHLGDPKQRAAGWKGSDRNPVFDKSEVDRMVQAGVQRLTDMQNADGGWGWFSGPHENSEAHSTSTVVRGLLVAKANDVAIVPDTLKRGLVWLEQYQRQELARIKEASERKPAVTIDPDNVDALVFHTLVAGGFRNEEMLSQLFEKRASLSVYGKALLAWATHTLGNREQTDMLRRNIEQFLVEDAENETAYLRDQSPWWYWYGSQIEATAIYLKLLAAMEPKGRVAPRLVKYLLNNRKHATYWNSTRDTALVVEAFTDYLRASSETQGNVNGEVLLGGKRLGSVSFTPATLFTAETTLQIAGDAVPTGRHSLEIRRQGAGPLYYSAYLTNFTLEEEIKPAGLELKIERRFYRLDPIRQQLDLAGDRAEIVQGERSAWRRVPIENLDTVASGSLVEVELLIDSKNDYEYLLIEEHKAAGLEPVDIQSGYQFVGGLGIYREMREKHVAFFLRTLPRGQHSLRYRLRAEAPGQFTALPAVISGMYAPELVGSSSDKEIRIEDVK